VYIKGEFLGGCDIVVDMHNSGELVTALKTVGHTSTWNAEAE
jgi:glutaredoxin-related protein